MTVTREDIQTVITETQPYVTEVFITEILKLIKADQAQYIALVDAAVAYATSDGPYLMTDLMKATKQFIKPLLSEKLDELADEATAVYWCNELRQLAAEARELEK